MTFKDASSYANKELLFKFSSILISSDLGHSDEIKFFDYLHHFIADLIRFFALSLNTYVLCILTTYPCLFVYVWKISSGRKWQEDFNVLARSFECFAIYVIENGNMILMFWQNVLKILHTKQTDLYSKQHQENRCYRKLYLRILKICIFNFNENCLFSDCFRYVRNTVYLSL